MRVQMSVEKQLTVISKSKILFLKSTLNQQGTRSWERNKRFRLSKQATIAKIPDSISTDTLKKAYCHELCPVDL
jgi:hypothetical protein